MGEYHTTTDAVRGYACTARTPVSVSTASSIATALTASDRSHGTRTRIRPAASDTTVSPTTRSVLVGMLGFGNRGWRDLLADALARLGHYVGDVEPRCLRSF